MAVSNVELIVNATKAINPLREVQRQTKRLQTNFTDLRKTVNNFQSAIAGVGFALLGKQAISAAASFNDLQTRLKLLTAEYGEFEDAQKLAAKAAKTFGLSTREATEGVTDIFARLRPLGVSLRDIESTFIGFNTVAKLSGASTVAASAAFTQLAQALGSGRLQGDEFRSISEQIPGILQAISKETGIAAGDLKDYASEGKLTSDIVINALKRIEREGADAIGKIVENSDIQKFKNFQNAVGSLQIAIGQGLLPVVTPLIENTTELIKQFASLPKPVQDGVIAITALTGAITILTPVVATASGLLSALAGPAVLGAAITALSVVGEKALAAAAGKQVLAASITAANTKITAMTVAVGALNLALKALPFALVAAGFATFIGQLQETKRVQKEVNDLINEGSVEQLNAALATNQRTLAEIEFQRTVLQATPGALGGFAKGAFDLLDQATGRTEALSTSIKILQGQLAEGMIGGGRLPQDQPKKLKSILDLDTDKDETKERVDMSEKMLKLLRERIELSKGENKVAIALKENEMRMLEIQESSLLPREKIAAQLEAEEMLHNDLRRIHGENLQLFLDQKAAAEKLGKTVADDYLKRLEEAAGPINQLYTSIGQSIETGIVDALSSAVDGTKKLADVASDVLRNIANILLQFGVNTALGGIPGFGQFFGGARANGGTVGGGRSYLVGEKGPELFTPGRTGSIAPSGSFGETNVVVNVDASGSQAQGNQPSAKALGAAIGAAVQAELIKQKRPGGLLS